MAIKMKAYQIKDIKNFMNIFLNSETFDHFYLEKATIVMGISYFLDGRIIEDFYQVEELELLGNQKPLFTRWRDTRTNCIQLIKGKKTPVAFQFTLLADPENFSNLSDPMIQAYVVNIKFEQGVLKCVTAVSYSGFTLDKTAEQEWDLTVYKFLSSCQFQVEEL